MDKELHQQSLAEASTAVRRRVFLARVFRWIAKTHWIFGGIAILALVVSRVVLDRREGDLVVVFAVLAFGLLFGAILALLPRLSDAKALQLLDRVGGWKDRFSSSLGFLQEEDLDDARELHIENTNRFLPEALSKFPRDFPLPSLKWVWILPMLAVFFGLSPVLKSPLSPGEMQLTEEMRNAAGAESEELRKEAERIAELESVTEEEKEALDKLRVSVEQVASDLADADGLTASEMLEALESRAREAERLADKMGVGNDGWASEALIEEMLRHPDTADLGLAIKDKEAEAAATESFRLHAVLFSDELKEETQARMTRTLEQVVIAAEDSDSAKPVGERIGNASRKLNDAQAKPAGREFEELGKHFEYVEQRREAQEKLENLAESIRNSGSEISGSELQKMEEIADSSSSSGEGIPGLQSLESDPLANDLQSLSAPQYSQQPGENQNQQNPGSLANQNGQGQPTPVPGSAPGEAQTPGGDQGQGSQQLAAPIPGEMPSGTQGGDGMAMSSQSQEGSGDGSMLTAPVPGMDGGPSSPGSGMNLGGASQSGQGGNQAGAGTAELIEQYTDPLKATEDSKVVAQINEVGESQVTAVEGQARAEQAERTRQEIVGEFIAAEEQALDGKAIPRSRRQHVMRYFSAIRREIEKDSQ